MSYQTRFPVLALLPLLAACAVSVQPDVSSGTTSGTGSGGAHSTAGTGGVMPCSPVVPCPVDVGQHCEQWYGLALGGTICFSEEGAGPTASAGSCIRVNPGILPAEFCCPPPPETDEEGEVSYPPCSTIAADCPSVNGVSAMGAVCAAFDTLGSEAVARCVPPTLPDAGAYTGDAYHCVPDPAWGQCGAESPYVLCCAH